MSDTAHAATPVGHAGPHVHVHAAPTGFWRKYIFSIDHKIIGIQYFLLALVSVFVGLTLSILMRIHLVYPTLKMPSLPFWKSIFNGQQMTPEMYLSLMTMHS